MTKWLGKLQVFDPSARFTIVERRLPHWSQAGAICFITWGTRDSIPKAVLRRWHADGEQWLRRHGVNGRALDWRLQLERLGARLQREFTRTFSKRWQRQLDACHGACLLRRPELSQIVSDSLLKFNGDRYQLTDFVAMPNHVHLLAAFADEKAMLKQCAAWEHYQATQINRAAGHSGQFWQQDGFDHLVRSLEQYDALRRYIADNPAKARLRPGEYRHYSK